MKKICLFLLFVVSFSYLYSQKIEVKSSIDNNKVIIGDWIKLDLKATHSNDIRINWPKLEDAIGKFEVVRRDSFPKIEDVNGDKVESLSAVISIYDSGYYQIPSLLFTYSTLSDTSKKVIYTEPINVSVNTLAVDTTLPIKEMKDVMDIPIPIMEILSYIAVILLIIMLGYAVWEHYNRKKAGRVVIKKVPDIPPHELAYNELKGLSEKQLWQRGHIKEYYTEVTEIIRRYIERRYNISAMEMTSSEIVNSLINIQHDAKIQEILKMFLNLADYVKFAKFEPNVIEHEDEMKRAFSFIDTTKLVEEPKEEEKAEESDTEKQEK